MVYDCTWYCLIFRFKLRIKTSNHDLQGVIEGDGEAEEEAVVPAEEQQMNEIVIDEAPSMYKVGVASDGRLKQSKRQRQWNMQVTFRQNCFWYYLMFNTLMFYTFDTI